MAQPAASRKSLQTRGKPDANKLSGRFPNVPRYLIRVHGQNSQGYMDDNQFIAEHELQSNRLQRPRLQIGNMSPQELEDQGFQHLTNFKGTRYQRFESCFISLGVSLRLALTLATLRRVRRDFGIRIAVLDTSTMTAANCDCPDRFCDNPFHQNPIWPAKMLYRACGGRTDREDLYTDEYVAFGHVRGTFKTCSFLDLQTQALWKYFPELDQITGKLTYTGIPSKFANLWDMEYPLVPEHQGYIMRIARQLSNDKLLTPMVALVLSIRRRPQDDRASLKFMAESAGLEEKKAMYFYLGEIGFQHVFDFYSSSGPPRIFAADAAEQIQTNAILDELPAEFTRVQEHNVWRNSGCTTAGLLCYEVMREPIVDGVTGVRPDLQKLVSPALQRAFLRLQISIRRSNYGGLRLLYEELTIWKKARITSDVGRAVSLERVWD